MKHSRKTYSDEGCTLFVLCNRHKKSGFAPRTGKLEEKLAGAGLFGYIDAIGDVKLTSKDAIATARVAYNKLTDAQKELVSNYDVLLAAIERYDEITGGAGTIHIGASVAAGEKGEQNPNTGAEVFGE